MNKRLWLFLICIAAFFGGILAGFYSSTLSQRIEIPTELQAEAVIGEDETIVREKIKEINYYFVGVQNDTLTVSKVFDDGSEEEIMNSYINMTNLPQGEKDILLEGAAFESMEEALMMAEAFVS